VLLPQWSIDRCRRKRGRKEEGTPLVVVESIAARQLVVAVDGAAAQGVRVGMTLAQARALCPAIEHAEHDPCGDARGLEGLGRWMIRFTPVVAAEFSGRAAGWLFLDVTGCERLYGGLRPLVEQVGEALARFRLGAARVALAPTAGAAWALAFAGGGAAWIVGDGEALSGVLAPLPVEALRIAPDQAGALRHLGVASVGQLLKLSRKSLHARFGAELLRRLDQALGRAPEPLVAIEPWAPVGATMEFEGVVAALEALWGVLRHLIGQLVADLARRGCGARRVDVEFRRPHAPAVRKSILLSRPSRDPENLFNLFRCALEEVQRAQEAKRQRTGRGRHRGRGVRVGASPADAIDTVLCPDGFTGVRVTVPVFERVSDEQIRLLDAAAHATAREFESLAERLRIRLGAAAVVRPELVESHVPERAWGAGEKLEDGGGRMESSEVGVQSSGEQSKIKNPKSKISSLPRPLHLLPVPTEIRVIVAPSEDREGRPVAVMHGGEVRPIAWAAGPERIAAQWWDARTRTRDYFAIEEAAGRRWWVFRVAETNRWYLHGVFE